jgi:hypothetical protein
MLVNGHFDGPVIDHGKYILTESAADIERRPLFPKPCHTVVGDILDILKFHVTACVRAQGRIVFLEQMLVCLDVTLLETAYV